MYGSIPIPTEIYSYTFSHITDVFFVLGVESPDSYKFLAVNPAFLDVTGLEESQVVGKNINEVIPSESLPMVLANYRKAINTKMFVQWHEVSQYPKGTKYGDVTIVPVFEEKGECYALVGTVHDVTELMEKEQELRRAKKAAEDALAVKNNFLETAAHELRNPSASLYLTLNSLVRKSRKGGQVNTRELEDLLMPSQRLNQQVKDLLDLARLEKDIVVLRYEHRDMVPLIKKWIGELSPLAPDRKIGLHCHVEKIELDLDPVRIYQVFANLLENSFKYSAPQGSIDVFLEQIPGRVRVSVKDTGEGIPPDQLPFIFNPFDKGSLDIRKRHTGLGLGLTISEKICKLHSGAIGVSSKVNEGSTFYFELPTGRTNEKR